MATTTTTARTASLPPLVFVLAAFGVIGGSFGGLDAIGTLVALSQPRDTYVQATHARYDAVTRLLPGSDLERFADRESDIRYQRRNAALPLAGVELILSMLLFAGAMRAMRGDPWGLGAWQLAALASLPYQLLSTALAALTARDLLRAFADSPPSAGLLVGAFEFERLKAFFFGGLAVVYFGTCFLYLRTTGVRRHFSVGAGRTPPSA